MPEPTPKEQCVAPAACPTCRAADVTTTSKTIAADTYWRCNACGEVWNVARRQQRDERLRRWA